MSIMIIPTDQQISVQLADRVVILCDHPFPAETAQASRIQSIVIGLVCNGCRLLVISPYSTKSYSQQLIAYMDTGIIEVLNIKSRINTFFYFKAFFYLLRCLKPAVFLYVSSSHPLQHVFSLFYRYLHRVPTVLDVGEWHSLKGLLQSRHFKSFAIEFLNQNVFIRNYSCAAAISSTIASKCRSQHISSLIIPALLPSSLTDVSTTNEVVTLANDQPFRLFYSGTLKPEDGIDRLIKALSILDKKYPNKYLLITSGSFTIDELRSSDKSVCCSLLDKIEHKGWLPTDVYNAEILSSDLVVIPRPMESINNNFSFPTRFVQALALGIPVAISDSSDIPKYLKPDSHYISLKDGSWQSIVNALDGTTLKARIEFVASMIPEAVFQFDPQIHAGNLLTFVKSLPISY